MEIIDVITTRYLIILILIIRSLYFDSQVTSLNINYRLKFKQSMSCFIL